MDPKQQHQPAGPGSAANTNTNLSKYRNIFGSTVGKPLFTHLKIDATAQTKLRCNESYFAVPWGGTNGSIGVFRIKKDLTETVKIEQGPPLLLAHGKPINDFEFCPLIPSVIASCTRTDALIRLWKLPSDELDPIPTGGSLREIDAANIFLAGHEKKVDMVRFHPTVGSILTSASSDGTVKLWEIDAMMDRITLTIPDSSSTQSITFDYGGDTMAIACTNGHIHIFDPRADTDPITSFQTTHSPSKSIRLTWLTPDPLMASSGFTKTGGGREIYLWDCRNLEKPVEMKEVSGTGTGPLTSFWDCSLPVLYVASKGEGLRVFELFEGSLRSACVMKQDKQSTQVDLMPKAVCLPGKCEIARFVRLSTDNVVDISCIQVPRVNSDTIFQEDLYPPMACVNPAGVAEDWFESKKSIEPILVEFVPTVGSATATATATIPIITPPSNIKDEIPEIKAPLLSKQDSSLFVDPTEFSNLLKRSSTLKRSTSTLRSQASAISRTHSSSGFPSILTKKDSSASITSSAGCGETSPSHAPSVVVIDGHAGLEKKGWFGNSYEPRYLVLKRSKFYVSADANSEVPITLLPLTSIKRVEGFLIGWETVTGDMTNQIGLSIDWGSSEPLRFKFGSVTERNAWMSAFKSVGVYVVGGVPLSSPTVHKTTSPSPLSSTSTGSPSMAPSHNKGQEMSRAGFPAPLLKTPSNHAVAASLGLAPPPVVVNSVSTVTNPSSLGSSRSPHASNEEIAKAHVAKSALLFGELKCLTGLDHASVKPDPSHWTPRSVVLDEDGMVLIYAEDAKNYSKAKSPMEILPLNSAISVRLSEVGIGLRSTTTPTSSKDSLNSNSSITSNIFQINTPKRVSYFYARNAYEAANWVMEIRKLINDSMIMPAAEMVTAEPVEGWVEVDLRNASGSTSSNLNGWFWLTVIDGGFYYFKTPLGTAPIYVKSAAEFEGVKGTPVADQNKTEEDDEEITDSEGDHFEVLFTSSGILKHAIKSYDRKDRWVNELLRIKMESFDILGRIGISTDGMLREEINSARGENYLENLGSKGVLVVDETLIQKGEMKTLISVAGKIPAIVAFIPLTWTSMRRDCAYVLDTGSIVYHWHGKDSSRIARAVAMNVATRLRKERSNRPRVVLVEEDEPSLYEAFTNLINPTNAKSGSDLSTLPLLSSEELLETQEPIRIFQVAASPIRRRRLKLVYEGVSPSKKLLEPEGVYVVQTPFEVFIWHGKGASSDFKALGLVAAKRMALLALEKNKRKTFFAIQKSYEGRESAVFREKFIDYEGSLPISMRMEAKSGHIASTTKQEPVDIPALYKYNPPIETPIDNGKSGRLKMFRVKDFQKEDVGAELTGVFFREESYIVMYTFRPPGSGVDKCISYFWQGAHSSVTQKGTSALMTIELSKETGGDVTQIRVVEGKETKHFASLFTVFPIIRLRSSQNPTSLPMAFDIRSGPDNVCKAVEVELQELQFNSNHVLLIITETTSYTWQGKYSTESERNLAEKVFEKYRNKESDKLTIVKETSGSLPSGFETAVKASEVALKRSKAGAEGRIVPRLFACSGTTGSVKEYAKLARPNSKVLVTFALQEPIEFTEHFHGWTRKKFPKDSAILPPRTRPIDSVLREYKQETFSVDILLGDKLPEHVDPTKLEMYLTEEDFETMFKIKKEEYMAMQPWKREKLKKEVGFF
ncbi:Coronin-2B [Blyttiomyces sp. JEL0837]|nr:Coronin-2B [Blyttiomyces sp. JEL0837]